MKKIIICLFAITILFIPSPAQEGTLIWNTFLGSSDIDYAHYIATDKSGNIYVTGESWGTWGSPVRAHSGGTDVLLAKLDSSGNLLWHTFFGSSTTD